MADINLKEQETINISLTEEEAIIVSSTKEETIDVGLTEEQETIIVDSDKEETINVDFSSSESSVDAQLKDINYIPGYKKSEEERRANELQRIANENERQKCYKEIQDDIKNKPSINGVPLEGNKTTEELGIVGTSMTEIEVSTNPEEPTDISIYFEHSGTYVAKNNGIIGFGELMTPIAKGGFFTVQNFKDDASKFGVEVPDEYNVTMISLFFYDGETFEEVLLKRIGIDEFSAAIKLTTENANDYLDLDIDVTNEVQQVLMNAVSSNYGMQLVAGRYLSFVSASNSEIDSASATYRVITPSNIKYAIEKWGASYYPTKQEHQELQNDLTTLETNVDTLKTEIETILDSVVEVNE